MRVQGRTVSFANTLLIMTSNVGSSAIAKGGGALGFQLPSEDADGGQYSRVRSLVMDELKVSREHQSRSLDQCRSVAGRCGDHT